MEVFLWVYENWNIHTSISFCNNKIFKSIDDLGNLGTLQPMGHLDFYPNGGRFQPGCDSIFSQASCSHSRARELFRDSLISACKLVAYECSDYKNFLQV